MCDGSDPHPPGDGLAQSAGPADEGGQLLPQAGEGLSAEAAIKACRADLADYVPAKKVLERLKEIKEQARSELALHAQWLVAKGIATNRLGLRGEALGDLNEAADIFERLSDGPRLAEAKREAAVVHAWCGEGREAGLALLRSVAESLALNDFTSAALALIEAGRLELEMGRPLRAAPLFDRALKIEGAKLPELQRRRVAVNQLQALVAAGLIEEAQRFREAIEPDVVPASPRLHLLVTIEQIRCACARRLFKEAHRLLEAARPLVPDRESFEAVELAEAEAELALAERDFALADTKLDCVVARFADDDLAGREVKARLLRAKALDGLKRAEDAERMLAAALRRAVARDLVGHADQVRTALAARGASESMVDLDTSLSPPAQDPTRRFVRRRPLGAGGQGSVSRAYDIELGGEVALKRVDLAALYDTAQRDRLVAAARTEIVAASRIDHPGVARVRGLIVEPGGDAILIEDLVDGPSLRSIMKGPIEAERALDLVARIAFALSAIHAAKIVHCDLKPENIVLAGPAHPVIIDFGIALLDPGQRSGRGTPAYMAPEQRRGGRIDARTDLYALGIIALELLGVEPEVARNFWGHDIWGHDNGVTKSLRAAGVSAQCVSLMRRLVAPVKLLRPRSAAEVSQIIVDATVASRRVG